MSRNLFRKLHTHYHLFARDKNIKRSLKLLQNLFITTLLDLVCPRIYDYSIWIDNRVNVRAKMIENHDILMFPRLVPPI